MLSKINGQQLTGARGLMRGIVMMPVGDTVHLTIWRDGREQEVAARVAEWPNTMSEGGVISAKVASAMIVRAPDPGIRLAPLTNAGRKQYGIQSGVTGALMSAVEEDCEARDLGIVAGDVIVAAQGQPVTSPDDVRRAVQLAHQQQRRFLALLVQNKAGVRWISLRSLHPSGAT